MSVHCWYFMTSSCLVYSFYSGTIFQLHIATIFQPHIQRWIPKKLPSQWNNVEVKVNMISTVNFSLQPNKLAKKYWQSWIFRWKFKQKPDSLHEFITAALKRIQMRAFSVCRTATMTGRCRPHEIGASVKLNYVCVQQKLPTALIN